MKKYGITRRDFLSLFLLSSFYLVGLKSKFYNRLGNLIRPPAALREDEFLNRCIRCGNCMKVCITNGLQPVLFQSGLLGIWTPQLVSEIGYCEYNCTLCGSVCPTGAIPRISLEQKHKTRLGLARIDRSICIPWSKNKECIVCEEHCPVPQKAIRLKREAVALKPFVIEELCIGCGLCQNKCPLRPVRAIRVFPRSGFQDPILETRS